MPIEKKKSINCLGTYYTILFDVPEDEMPCGADGVMDYTSKTIKIAEMKPDKDSVEIMSNYRYKVLRHEIIHAFLYESGLHNNSHSPISWATDEEIVDWFAIQLPKINEVLMSLDLEDFG